MKPSSLILLIMFGFSSFATNANELEKALELTPNTKHGEKVYRLCATCHGKNGWGKKDGSFPVIAGQYRKVIIKQLADIRTRKRENPTMYPFSDPATIGGAQAIADVAEYIQSLPRNPDPGQGDGNSVEQGKQLYGRYCQDCHQKDAEGLEAAFLPRLNAQHFKYLERQIEWIKNGRRKNSNPEMVKRLKELKENETTAIIDYISRISLK